MRSIREAMCGLFRASCGAQQIWSARRPIKEIYMTLLSAKEGIEYIIESIFTDDEELDGFLFSLGCYSGEPITVIARRYGTLVVSIKDARYTIDNALADAIKVKE